MSEGFLYVLSRTFLLTMLSPNDALLVSEQCPAYLVRGLDGSLVQFLAISMAWDTAWMPRVAELLKISLTFCAILCIKLLKFDFGTTFFFKPTHDRLHLRSRTQTRCVEE